MNLLEKIKPAYVLIILLSLISQRFIYNEVLYPELEWRIESLHSALKGEIKSPYQYRILKPLVSTSMDKALTPLISDQTERYKFIFKFLLFFGFFFLYFVYYHFLKNFYSDTTAIIGLLLLQTAIPLTITDNCWEEGDVITLFFCLLAFYCMFKQKDYFIPLVIGIGTLNREQTIFFLVFYAAYLYEQKRLFTLKSTGIMVTSGVLYFMVYFGLRMYFGYKPNQYISTGIPAANLSHWTSILRLWVEQVLMFVIASVIVYKRSRLFFRLSILCLIPFTILFFLYGVMGELGKYLPALLILITVSLQMLRGEYTISGKKEMHDPAKARLKFM